MIGVEREVVIEAAEADELIAELVVSYRLPRWQRMRQRRQSAPLPPHVDTVGLEARLAERAKASERITRTEWDAARQVLLTRLADA